MDWTLERVNVPGNFIVLEKGERSYPCGRKLGNKIFCPNLVVSRRHCLFVRADDVISVIDLGSSNGIFVNHQAVEPNELIELKENDIIGIGSSEEYRDNEPMFVFKLRKGNWNSRNLEEFGDLLTQRSSTSSNNVQSSNNPRASDSASNERAGRLKRSLPDPVKQKNEQILPAKVSRFSNGLNEIPDVAGKKVSSSTKFNTEVVELLDVEEIEEIWSTLNPQKISKPKTNGTAAGHFDAFKKPDINSDKSNRLTLNIENENERRKSSKIVDLIQGETELPTSMNAKVPSEKELQSNSCGLTSPNNKPQKLKVRPAESVERIEPAAEKGTTLISEQENSHKTFRFSLDSSSSSTRLTVDILESNKNSRAKESKLIRRRSSSPCSLKRKEEKTKFLHANEAATESSEIINGRKEARKFLATSSQAEDNGKRSKFEPDRFSFSNKDPVAASSPLKLKLVKHEPMKSFSISDTVNLSDDDDDIFPSSQLFDSTAESNLVNAEDESPATKPDHLTDDEEEDDKIFTDIDTVARESEEIITLSDSEDEDNTWLHRLSESQRVKEEEPEIPKPEIPGAEIAQPESPEMEFVDELLVLKQDLSDELKIEDVETSRKEETIPKLIPRSIIKSPRPMTSSEIEKDLNEKAKDDESDNKEEDDEFDSDIFHESDRSPSSSAFSPSFSSSSSSSPPPSFKKRKKSLDDISLKINQGTPKGPKLIDPLRLPQRKRLSLKDSSLPSSTHDSTSPSTSRSHFTVRDCSVKVPKLPSNLTVKQKRELQLEDRIKQKKYEEEQRIRRIKNKWAQNVPLRVGRRSSPPITKKQKIKIVNERKEKLKALANKQKLNSVQPQVGRVAAKVKAKVSTKNRGDFLINEHVGAPAKAAPELAQVSTSKKEAKSPKRKPKNSETTSKSTSSRKPARNESNRREESKTKSSPSPSTSTTTKEKKRGEKKSNIVEKSKSEFSATSTVDKKIETLIEMSLNQKENRVPNSLDKKEGEDWEKRNNNNNEKKKKKVTFNENLFTVRVFEIDPRNTMKKCTGKDALIPREKLAAVRKIDKSQHPKLEEFLMHIFQWNPSWLEEQKHLKTEPPIVNNDTLVPLLTRYRSYKDYYQVLMPLLLLELWHGITKEFECIDKNNRRQTVFCSIVNNSVTFEPIPSTNTSLTTMLLEVLASEEDIRRQMHPVYGDLVFLELCYKNDEGKQNFLKVFAYVKQLYRTSITPHTFFNRDLMNYTANPSRVLTYTVLTRPLKVQLCINRVLRLRCVTYLRANMRMVQALQSLPSSPLLDLIINPKVEHFPSPYSAKQQSTLVTGDNLNCKQLEAVFKTTNAIIRKEPKLCLVQGPPGTGKSEVIINMVMQILYGDNRYRNKESTLRILLCAPSNAAIDEIVLRLLDRRAKLTNDRFKMVRVGIPGPMHPRVREISVEELAKRDVKQTISGYQTYVQSRNSVEEEKRFLEAKVNALQSKLSSSQKTDANQIQFTKMRLLEAKTRYDLINKLTQSNGNNVNPQDLIKLQRGAENKILTGADIIACTLSSCYTNIMESVFGGMQQNISVCIVDEATQSCEAETLIPLMLGVNTLVLVGDPAQLPATIISQRAKLLGLDQSLFSRAQRAFEGHVNSPVIMLDTQYRMDAHISYWPNMYFYSGKLKNGSIREQPVLPLQPYRVLNLDSLQNLDKFSNTQEAEFVANLIYGMINYLDGKKIAQPIRIGVITPYRNQQSLVQAKINSRILPIVENLKIKVSTEVNTVDSFQGHERDIIIMSCVRSNGIGFLSDPQRLCVALTRAKHCLVLCGNFGTFQRDTMWRALLADARSRKNYIEMRSEARPSEIISQLVR